MKLLFVLTPAFNPNNGGVQRTTYKLGKHFTENGIDVTYFSFAPDGHADIDYGKLFYALEPGGVQQKNNLNELVRVIGLTRPDIVINQMPYEASLRNVLSSCRSVYNFILLGCLRNSLFSFKSNAAEIIRNQYPGFISRLLTLPLFLSFIQYNHRRKHGKELKQIIDAHDKFVLLTPKNADELAFFVGNYKSDKIESIPNSIPEVFSELEHKEKTVLYVGRLNIPQKRADIILPVWERIYKEFPDWNFIVVGDGPFMEHMKSEIQKKGLSRILLTGYEKPESYYKTSSVFLMPSAYEGFPNVIIEAQSYGVVPVAFDSYASLGWIVNNGKDALLVKPFDINAMADATKRLMKDASLLKGMRESSFENAQRFTINNVGMYWFRLFEKLGYSVRTAASHA